MNRFQATLLIPKKMPHAHNLLEILKLVEKKYLVFIPPFRKKKATFTA